MPGRKVQGGLRGRLSITDGQLERVTGGMHQWCLRRTGEGGPHALHDRQLFVLCDFRKLRSEHFVRDDGGGRG